MAAALVATVAVKEKKTGGKHSCGGLPTGGVLTNMTWHKTTEQEFDKTYEKEVADKANGSWWGYVEIKSFISKNFTCNRELKEGLEEIDKKWCFGQNTHHKIKDGTMPHVKLQDVKEKFIKE